LCDGMCNSCYYIEPQKSSAVVCLRAHHLIRCHGNDPPASIMRRLRSAASSACRLCLPAPPPPPAASRLRRPTQLLPLPAAAAWQAAAAGGGVHVRLTLVLPGMQPALASNAVTHWTMPRNGLRRRPLSPLWADEQQAVSLAVRVSRLSLRSSAAVVGVALAELLCELPRTLTWSSLAMTRSGCFWDRFRCGICHVKLLRRILVRALPCQASAEA
jgi:hypothetical protein